MDEMKRKQKIQEGKVILGWVALSIIIFVITLLAWVILQTKIAMFLLGIGTLLLVLFITLFLIWKSLSKH